MIDTHCHLDRLSDPHGTLAQCFAGGISAVIAPTTGEASLEKTLELAAAWPGRVFPAVGIHPERTPSPALWEEARRLAGWIDENHGRITAIGEIGLPVYSLQPEEEIPPLSFRILDLFLERAVRWDLPVILHAVHRAAAPCLERLAAHGVQRAVFHWLKAPEHAAQQILDAGYFVSVTPEVTAFPRDQKLAAMAWPRRLLLETDAPEPLRIQKPEEPSPLWVRDSLVWLAARMGEPESAAERITDENARTLFRI